jgi:hypothetical protein
MFRLVFAALLATGAATTLPSPALAAEGTEVCVVNGSDERFLFAVVPREGDRRTAPLAPGESLCSAAPHGKGGFVSVFENAQSDEGCSRLVEPPGGTRTLRRYASFDRCAWDDNT